MPLGQMQVNGRYFKVSMAEQDLDRAQVGTGFKKVGRETVAQSVGMDAPVIEASSFGGNLAGGPEDFGSHRTTGCVPTVARKEPLLRLAPEPAPIDAQLFEQLRTERDIVILTTLALPDTGLIMPIYGWLKMRNAAVSSQKL